MTERDNNVELAERLINRTLTVTLEDANFVLAMPSQDAIRKVRRRMMKGLDGSGKNTPTDAIALNVFDAATLAFAHSAGIGEKVAAKLIVISGGEQSDFCSAIFKWYGIDTREVQAASSEGDLDSPT